MSPKRAVHWVLRLAALPSFWALVALVFVAFLLAWVYQLSRDTQELAKENRTTLVTLKKTQTQLKDAIIHQCKTDAAHDIAVREFIRKEKDRGALGALFGLHLLLTDTSTCKDVSG